MPTSGTWAATTGAMMAPATRSKSSYRLDGGEVDLKAQVGHKVEVVGTIEPRHDGAPKGGDTEHLRVASVRMIAAGCSK
jgi:hypothetical protein